MGQTIVEKILSAHCGASVRAGDVVVANVDRFFFHDGNRPLVSELLDAMRDVRPARPEAVAVVIDHAPTAPNRMAANVHRRLREFASKYNLMLVEQGDGVCHQVLPERGFILPGSIVIGTDSHTCTMGAFNALATGMGSSDVAVGIASGQTWFRVPSAIQVHVTGTFGPGVMAKDLILWLIGKLTAAGATYKALEFAGPGLESLSVEGRMTVCNMAVEAGAKCAIMPCDSILKEWLKEHAPAFSGQGVAADEDAEYESTVDVDLSQLEPQVSRPHAVDQVCSVKEVEGLRINEGVIGTCTNGRIEDLRVADRILRGRRLAPGVRLVVTPASRTVLQQALAEGIIARLVEAGALIGVPGCTGCTGAPCFGVPADDDVVVTTANRNFRGRLGNPGAELYLASPATVAASVVTGRITDPREFL